MQIAGAGKTIRTSMPREVVEREARIRGLSVDKFVKEFRVKWRYNNFDGAFASFIPSTEPKRVLTSD